MSVINTATIGNGVTDTKKQIMNLKSKVWIAVIYSITMIYCTGDDAANTNQNVARGELEKTARSYVNSLKISDQKTFESLFASEATLGKSAEWRLLFRSPAIFHDDYILLKESYMDDFKFLKEKDTHIDWTTVVFQEARIIGPQGNEIAGLRIEIDYGINGSGAAYLFTGPLIMEADQWKFAGRAKGPPLF